MSNKGAMGDRNDANRRTKPTGELATVTQVTLAVKNIAGETFPQMNLTPGEPIDLPGTLFKLLATDFYTHWNWDNGPVNLSFMPRNPAIKVEVMKDDSVLFHQWAFKTMPFFGLGDGMKHPGGGGGKELAFTLVDYTGLSIPGLSGHFHGAIHDTTHEGDPE